MTSDRLIRLVLLLGVLLHAGIISTFLVLAVKNLPGRAPADRDDG